MLTKTFRRCPYCSKEFLARRRTHYICDAMECKRVAMREYVAAYRKRHVEKIREYRPNADRVRENKARYRRKHLAKLREYQRRYRKKHPEKGYEQQARHEKKYPGRRNGRKRNRLTELRELQLFNLVQPNMTSPYLTCKEAAEYLRTTEQGIYSLVKRRRLRPLPGRPGRLLFTREILDSYLTGKPKRKP